jgi:hypothetical protein
VDLLAELEARLDFDDEMAGLHSLSNSESLSSNARLVSTLDPEPW